MRMFYTRVLLCVHVTRPFRSVPENGISVNKGELSRLQGAVYLVLHRKRIAPVAPDFIGREGSFCSDTASLRKGVYMSTNGIGKIEQFQSGTARKQVEADIGYSFRKPYLLAQAFTRKSYTEEMLTAWTNPGGEAGAESNETLEFIGDKALDLVVMRKLIDRYGEFREFPASCRVEGHFLASAFRSARSEGNMTELKSALVCRETLAAEIERLGWSRYLIMSNGDELQNVENGQKAREDLFEAVFGAVALDCGWNFGILSDVAERMLLLGEKLDNGFGKENAVGDLQTVMQRKFHLMPEYTYRETKNGFSCTVRLFDDTVGIVWSCPTVFSGIGKSKKEAAVEAASEALEWLRRCSAVEKRIRDLVGNPTEERAVNQLQELWQKKYEIGGKPIGKPVYVIVAAETDPVTGNATWQCACSIEGRDMEETIVADTKAEAKQFAAFCMLSRLVQEEATRDAEDVGC